MNNKKRTSCKVVNFCQMFDALFRLYNPFPPLGPRRPLHMLYIYIATFNCTKGILGLAGGGGGGGGGGRETSKIKLKDANFIFSMTNVTILSIFRMHALNEYCNVQKIKGTYIHNVLALLLFGNLQRIY